MSYRWQSFRLLALEDINLSPCWEMTMKEHLEAIHDADFAAIIRERINACLSESAPLEVVRLEDELLRAFPDFRDRRIIRDKITATAMRRGVPMVL